MSPLRSVTHRVLHLTLVMLSGVGAALAAQSAPGRERPAPPVEELFVTAVPFTQERGEFQLGTLAHSRRVGGRRAFDMPFEIEYGIADWLELSLETAGLRYDSGAWSQGVSHSAQAALTVAHESILPGLHMGLSVGAEFARGENGEESETELGAQILAAWALPFRLHAVAALPTDFGQCKAEAGRDGESRCSAGAIMSVGRARFSIEHPFDLRTPSGARLAVVGLSARLGSGQIGIGTTTAFRGRAFVSGLRLIAVRDF